MICGEEQQHAEAGGDDADVVERQHQHLRSKKAQHAKPVLRLDLTTLVGHPR
jgi:hypothetical protein